MLGDEGINLICGLLPPDGAKSGEYSDFYSDQIVLFLSRTCSYFLKKLYYLYEVILLAVDRMQIGTELL